MTPAERLRALVKEATPGPWYAENLAVWTEGFEDDGLRKIGAIAVTGRDARLIALAPQLAEEK